MPRFSVPGGRLLRRVPGYITTSGHCRYRGTKPSSQKSSVCPAEPGSGSAPEADTELRLRALWTKIRFQGRNWVLTGETIQKQSPKKLFVGMSQEMKLLLLAKQKSIERARKHRRVCVGWAHRRWGLPRKSRKTAGCSLTFYFRALGTTALTRSFIGPASDAS